MALSQAHCPHATRVPYGFFRTWPNLLNLVDLPASGRVKARAKMFVDIAMVEAEQASLAGVRGGQKFRAKRDDITANMYSTVTPAL